MESKYLMGETRSAWNFALCPGWTSEEVEALVLLLKFFGFGKWTKIEKSGRLPSKTIQQMYLQTQRIVGQQSLAAFMGLHLDVLRIGQDNEKIDVSFTFF